jgi:hypothetical protein
MWIYLPPDNMSGRTPRQRIKPTMGQTIIRDHRKPNHSAGESKTGKPRQRRGITSLTASREAQDTAKAKSQAQSIGTQ